ncbi:MAG: TonB-dependent receptor plug domain-containing protein, partial [Gemmatimonadaceae bacterium]
MGFVFTGVARLITILLVLTSVVFRSIGANAQVVSELRGRVTDAETARPIVDGRVEVVGRSDAVRTGMDGSYVVRGLEPAVYTIAVRALGYAPYTREIEIKNGRTALVDAALIARVAVLNEVRVRAVRDTLALNTTVLDRTSIEHSGRRDLGELLQAASGVVVTQEGGPGRPSYVSIRGSSSNQVLVLVDGVPMNSAISGSTDLSRISLETVDKITVRTGAQSARYGPRAMAGVIEIETRKPRREASIFFRSGAFGEHNAAVTAGNTRSLGRAVLGGVVGAEYRAVDGDFPYELPALRGGGRATRINSDAASKQLSGGLTLDGTATSASIRGTWQNTERGLAGTIIQPSATGRQGNARTSLGGSAQGMARKIA